MTNKIGPLVPQFAPGTPTGTCSSLRAIRAEAILLFGNQIPARTLTVSQTATPLLIRGSAALPILHLARKIGVKLTGNI